MPQNKPRKTLKQMASEAAGSEKSLQINGKPADRCPYCGCALFVNGTRSTDQSIYRYVNCRNPNCRRGFLSKQPPATLIRETDDSSSGQERLTLYKESA